MGQHWKTLLLNLIYIGQFVGAELASYPFAHQTTMARRWPDIGCITQPILDQYWLYFLGPVLENHTYLYWPFNWAGIGKLSIFTPDNIGQTLVISWSNTGTNTGPTLFACLMGQYCLTSILDKCTVLGQYWQY